MEIKKGYDFAGWASKANVRCGDGLVIRSGAFSAQDGEEVPLVYMHDHKDNTSILGHAILQDRDEGLYCYGYLNDTPNGEYAKKQLAHGDLKSLSIWANNLTRDGRDVIHGVVREVSLCLAGQNPGAFIESVVAHGVPMDDYEDEGIIYSGEDIVFKGSIAHAVNDGKDDEKEGGDAEMNESESTGKTVGQILDDLSDDEKVAVAMVIDEVIKKYESGSNSNAEEEGEDVKHNSFEDTNGEYISHGVDFNEFMASAKREGSMRAAVEKMIDEGEYIQHDGLPSGFPTGSTVDTTGMTTSDGSWRSMIPNGRPTVYGFNDPSLLFPDAHNLNKIPEWINRDIDWVDTVLNGVKRIPFSRIKTQFADITMEEARAKGYTKTHAKTEELFRVMKRQTQPTTVYKKQRMDRDDVIDITDFDVIDWIKSEMRIKLNEELARAILIGDGRTAVSDDKINEDCIRPIISDDPLFNVKIPIAVKHGATSEEQAKAVIRGAIKNRKKYKGSGNPIFFTTEDWVTEMLLLEDGIGHRLYKTEAELATALRVSRIVTVEVMEGMTIPISTTSNGVTTVENKLLIGITVNLTDYTVGADKGGSIEMFDDFDIDYNQMIYLMETRISGALTKAYSALTLYLDEAAS